MTARVGGISIENEGGKRFYVGFHKGIPGAYWAMTYPDHTEVSFRPKEGAEVVLYTLNSTRPSVIIGLKTVQHVSEISVPQETSPSTA